MVNLSGGQAALTSAVFSLQSRSPAGSAPPLFPGSALAPGPRSRVCPLPCPPPPTSHPSAPAPSLPVCPLRGKHQRSLPYSNDSILFQPQAFCHCDLFGPFDLAYLQPGSPATPTGPNPLLDGVSIGMVKPLEWRSSAAGTWRPEQGGFQWRRSSLSPIRDCSSKLKSPSKLLRSGVTKVFPNPLVLHSTCPPSPILNIAQNSVCLLSPGMFWPC